MNRKSMLLKIALGFVLITFTVNPEGRAAQKEQPKTGGTLLVGLGKDIGNPNPFVGTSSSTQFVRETSYESLLTTDNDGRVTPNLAEAYEVSSSGTAFTLRLRRNVKFHNGKAMRADDVIWSATHVRDPKNGATGQNLIKDMKSIEKIDDYTVKFTLNNPSVIFLFYLSDIRMLPIVPANSLQTGQIKLEPNTFLPGTGPFILEQFQPGFDTVVRKFQDYWGTPAYLDKVIFRPLADDTNRFNALRTGDVQLADRIAPMDIARVRKGDVKGVVILEEPLGGSLHLIMNSLDPLLQKLEMRQALTYAIDKQRMADEVFFGAAIPSELMMDPRGIWSKAANLPKHKRDLAKAKALLKTAGYNGQELVLIGRKGTADRMESCQRMLAEAGVKIKIEVLEAGVMNERIIGGKYDLNIDGGNTSSDPVITLVPEYYTSKVEKGRYSSPKVDKLFDTLSTEFDEKKRLATFRELAWTLHNEVASIPLLFEARYVAMSEKVQNYGPPKGYNYSASGNYFKQVWLK